MEDENKSTPVPATAVMSTDSAVDDLFGKPLQMFGNFERIKAFEDVSNTGSATIYCIYGAYASGKSRLVSRMHCSAEDPIILDGESFRFYVANDLIIDDKDNKVLAVQLARIAHYFAMMGKDVIIDTIRADVSYDYLVATLQDVNDKRSHHKKRYSQGVDVTIHKIKTEGVRTFNK